MSSAVVSYSHARGGSSELSLAAVMCEAVKNPVYSLLVFAPQQHRRIIEIRRWANYALSFLLSAVIVVCALKFVSLIPGDIAVENRRISFFNRQIGRRCRSEYVANGCNASTVPALAKRCEQWRSCFEGAGQVQRPITAVDYAIDLLNNFFVYLTPKTAAVLGSVCGVVLFCSFYFK